MRCLDNVHIVKYKWRLYVKVKYKLINIEKILEKLGLSEYSILKLERKMFVHTAPCSQFSKEIKAIVQSYSEAGP